MASSSALQELLLALEKATPVPPPIPSDPEADTPPKWGQTVIDSASSLLADMKHRRAAQRDNEEFLDDGHPDSRASKSTDEQADAPESMDPVILRERLVFRANVPIDAEALMILHQSYKDAEAVINNFLIAHGGMLGKETLSCPDEDCILLRCALREEYEA
ncbi:MAG: hypothetical protein Q9200_002452, partial [Gallowayella weberi]